MREEGDTSRGVEVEVARDVVGVEEDEDAAAGLAADARELLFGCSASEEDCRAGGGGRVWRLDSHPAFLGAQVGVFEENEIELAAEEGDCFVVVANGEGELGEVHRRRAYPGCGADRGEERGRKSVGSCGIIGIVYPEKHTPFGF